MRALVQSQEGAALVEIQTSALFGDLRKLQEQMQQAVGQEAVNSMEDLMQRVQVSCRVLLLINLLHPCSTCSRGPVTCAAWYATA